MNRWKRWLPGLQILRTYQPAWFARDLMAGLVLTMMLVPVGIAYALASGVPGIYGLYATIVPLLAYALFGPSRILVLGPDSSLAPVILAVVFPLSGGDPMRAVALASMMAVVSGLVCVLIGMLRLGFVTELISKPIRYGYMNGIALTVLISQVPKLRLLGRWRRSIARPGAHRRRHSRRTGELDVICSRRQHTRRDPFAQAI
jgi:MFS superfamily sulfate permease-like transporter